MYITICASYTISRMLCILYHRLYVIYHVLYTLHYMLHITYYVYSLYRCGGGREGYQPWEFSVGARSENIPRLPIVWISGLLGVRTLA